MAEKKGFNRRDFFKVIGAGAGLAAAGCSKELPEKFIPYVIQPDEVVPGIATWYAGFCNECSAGCGTMARVREGRVTKIEGLPKHPVNEGGLCAIGQSSVQALYDPDRIREPLKRDVGGAFTPLSWTDAIDAFGQMIADAKGGDQSVVFVTKRLSGSEAKLLKEFSKGIKNFQHIEYELSDQDAIEIAAEKLFGQSLKVSFDFSKADTVIGIGADYLETWGSPVRNARGWASRRKPDGGKMSRVVHIEPRLSLTAGNADRWLMNAPGSELGVLLAVLKELAAKPTKQAAAGGALDAARSITKAVDLNAVSKASGLTVKDIQQVADELYGSPRSLVVAGGAAVGADAVAVHEVTFLINALLGNIGSTVELFPTSRKARSGYSDLVSLCNDLVGKKKKVAVMAIYGTNPVYTLPVAAQFKPALNQVGSLVAFSAHQDETTLLASLVLPLSHQLESWGDSDATPGVFSLNQPGMQPLYKTQCFGDSLISTLNSSKLKASIADVNNFEDYLKQQWKGIIADNRAQAKDWLSCVERGGVFVEQNPLRGDAIRVSQTAFGDDFARSAASAEKADALILMTYPSINSQDGSSANRPWLQELPNPITSAVWGSWVEMHPDVAAKAGVSTGDTVQLVSDKGFIEAPAYVSKYVHPGVVAVPLGQGHEGYGRYATAVGANALSILSVPGSSDVTPLSGTAVTIKRPNSRDTLVMLQGSDTQLKRGIGRVITLEEFSAKGHKSAHAAHGEHEHRNSELAAFGFKEEEEEDHLALGPREEPKMMYRQSEHPVYRWGMSIDLASCTGCSACVVACFAENNIPTVGKTICDEGREMAWLRIERYLDGPDDAPIEGFVPMMCQQCNNAPCEPVCPVYATYHSEDGLNSMTYNRCVGTRYCLNNCSYKVRRFNWYRYDWPTPSNWQLNPDVTVREVGVMEKCTFCVQRIREAQGNAKDEGRLVNDGEIQPACASSCPTKAISFGNLKDKESEVAKLHEDERSYKVLDVELNTQPAVAYLARVRNTNGSAVG